jgi:alkyl hydroperoxide reductase subunit AhpF
MSGLSSEDKATVEKKFEALKEPVTIILHKPEGKTENLDDFISVLEEITGISDLLSFQDMVEMETDEDMIHDVEMFPAIVLLDKDGNDHGIRFYGVPMSRIFNSFIDAITLFSNGEVGYDEEMKERIRKIEKNRLLVLGTPSVPGLDGYLDLLFGLSYLSENIECAVCDLTQFPQVAEDHHVLDMPKTISNDELRFTGVYNLDETLEILEKRIADAED